MTFLLQKMSFYVIFFAKLPPNAPTTTVCRGENPGDCPLALEKQGFYDFPRVGLTARLAPESSGYRVSP